MNRAMGERDPIDDVARPRSEPRENGPTATAIEGDRLLHNGASSNGAGAHGTMASRSFDVELDGEEPHANGSSRFSTSLVIPTRNEGRNLASLLERIPSCVDEVIMVDGSSDVTARIARDIAPDIRIIRDPVPGKGHALRLGFEEAKGDVIVAMDADGSMSPEEIPQLLFFLQNGFDFVHGSRFVGGGGSVDITTLRKLGNRVLVALLNAMYHERLTDLCYGFFAFRSCYLDCLELHSVGFEIETEIMIHALRAGLRVAEVPSLELARHHGRSNLHAFHDGMRVLETLLRERLIPVQWVESRTRPWTGE